MIRRFFTGKLRRLILISFAVQAAGLCLFLLSFHQQQKISLETAERNFENGTRVLENEMAWCTDCLDDLTTRMINYLSLRRGSDLDRIHRLEEMREYFYILRNISGREYNFFLYSEEDGLFLNLTTVGVPFERSRPIIMRLQEPFTDALSEIGRASCRERV